MNPQEASFWVEVTDQLKEEIRVLSQQGIVLSAIEVGNLLSKIAASKRAQINQTDVESVNRAKGEGR
jgi:hypothetical protein